MKIGAITIGQSPEWMSRKILWDFLTILWSWCRQEGWTASLRRNRNLCTGTGRLCSGVKAYRRKLCNLCRTSYSSQASECHYKNGRRGMCLSNDVLYGKFSGKSFCKKYSIDLSSSSEQTGASDDKKIQHHLYDAITFTDCTV